MENEVNFALNGISHQQEISDVPEDIELLKSAFIAEGGNPNLASHQKGELRARQKAHAEIEAEEKRKIESRGRFSRWAAATVRGGLEFVAVLFTLILVLGGLLLATGLLILAEIAAVQKGFQVIDPEFAGLYSVATVLFFIVVLFIREVIARNATQEEHAIFSLRFVANWLVYFLGLRRLWQPHYKQHRSLLSRVDTAITWLMWTIVVFGLLGRLADKIDGLEGNWLSGIRHIVTESGLRDAAGYVGATVMTVALLFGTHFIIYFVHQIYVKVTGGLDANFTEDFALQWSPDFIIEREVKSYWKTELLKLRAKNQSNLLPPLLGATTA